MPSRTAHVRDTPNINDVREEEADVGGRGAEFTSGNFPKAKFKVSFPKAPDNPELAKQLEELNDSRRRQIRQNLHDINDYIDENQVRFLRRV